jgi:deazaflavin-dependent oxidoreductase (nitroreductase family)
MATTETTAAPRRLRRMARIFKLVNVLMRPLLALPFRTPINKQLMLVHYRGRNTGKSYRQPVSYVTSGDVLLTPGGGKWKLNLRGDQPVTLTLRGRKIVARPELVRDRDEVDRLLREMIQKNPRITRFVPFVNADGTIDEAQMRNALDHGFAIVRWHLDRRAATSPDHDRM